MRLKTISILLTCFFLAACAGVMLQPHYEEPVMIIPFRNHQINVYKLHDLYVSYSPQEGGCAIYDPETRIAIYFFCSLNRHKGDLDFNLGLPVVNQAEFMICIDLNTAQALRDLSVTKPLAALAEGNMPDNDNWVVIQDPIFLRKLEKHLPVQSRVHTRPGTNPMTGITFTGRERARLMIKEQTTVNKLILAIKNLRNPEVYTELKQQ